MALCRITFLWPSIKLNNNQKKTLNAHRQKTKRRAGTRPMQIESDYMQSMVSIDFVFRIFRINAPTFQVL